MRATGGARQAPLKGALPSSHAFAYGGWIGGGMRYAILQVPDQQREKITTHGEAQESNSEQSRDMTIHRKDKAPQNEGPAVSKSSAGET